MGDLLDFESILDIDEIDTMFESRGYSEEETEEKDTPEKTTEHENTTTEVSNEETQEEPESVSSEEYIEEKKDPSPKGKGSSPNFYSSIASALREEGVFPDLDEDNLKKVDSADSFKSIIEKQIQAGLDERQQRIDKALNAGVEVTAIKKYENTLDYLDNIDNKVLEDEGEQGENLRKNLIYQDFINRGYSKERAAKEVQKSLNAGTDLEDAKDALQSNKDFFNNLYDNEVKEAQKEEKKKQDHIKESLNKLKTSVMEDEKFIGDLTVDKSIRKKIYENVTKASYRDPDSGMYITALQKYEKENKIDFLKNVGILFTLTDGFKNIDNLVKGKVKKEVSKGLKNLEYTLNTTTRDNDGNLRYISGVSDEDSYLSSDWDIYLE